MASTKTVVPRNTASTGANTITSISASAGLTDFSLHDCTDPGQVSVMNCVWPLGTLPGGAGGGIAVKNGVTVHSRNPQTLSVTITLTT